MKICYFGTYDRKRPRNRIVIQGLKENGIEVIECHFSIWGNIEDKSQIKSPARKLAVFIRFLLSWIVLSVKYLFLKPHQAVVVGYFGHLDMLPAKLLCILKNRPLYFNAFLSLYDTMVEDRKVLHANSLLARVCFYLDKISCQLADRVFLDTKQQIDYFVQKFKLNRAKFDRLFVGAETDIFYPRKMTITTVDDNFKVLFYGQFIPLQGVEFIVEAARLLKDEAIKFTIIGRGQEYEKIFTLAKELQLNNISWIDWVVYNDLPEYIAESDICLGIFGSTEKARRVIPNKAFQAIAMGKTLITGDSAAARELFINGESAALCKMANPSAIAESIIQLKKEAGLRNKISKHGYELFKAKCTPRIIGQELLNCLPVPAAYKSEYNFR